jgi:hypothetical protein
MTRSGGVAVAPHDADLVAERLRAGISSAFFRFYFDADDPESQTLVVRVSALSSGPSGRSDAGF